MTADARSTRGTVEAELAAIAASRDLDELHERELESRLRDAEVMERAIAFALSSARRTLGRGAILAKVHSLETKRARARSSVARLKRLLGCTRGQLARLEDPDSDS